MKFSLLGDNTMVKAKKKEVKKPSKIETPKKEPAKKEVAKKEVSKTKVKEKTKLKEDIVQEDDGIIVVEDEAGLDKEAELEARKAYLEEARSQEASED
jgi:co-chaperonin GroES (HSP10)